VLGDADPSRDLPACEHDEGRALQTASGDGGEPRGTAASSGKDESEPTAAILPPAALELHGDDEVERNPSLGAMQGMRHSKSMTRLFGKPEAGSVTRTRLARPASELDATDLKLSRGLSRLLGLAAPLPEKQELEGEPDGQARPSPLASNRGVHIEGFYEYCTVRSKIQVCKMGADVIHRRMKGVNDDLDEEEMQSVASTESMQSEDSARKTTSTESSQTSSGKRKKQAALQNIPKYGSIEDVDENVSGPRYASARPHWNQEALSRWGLIVGAILHSRALDFGSAARRAMQRKVKKAGQLDRIESEAGIAQRGKLFHHVRAIARAVTKQARKVARRICKEDDVLDSEWSQEGSLPELFGNDYVDNIFLIATAARKILAVQPPLAEATAPCRVFGDLHGHFRDLLLLFVSYGGPDEHNAPMFVFNGDFVDRGEHQIEVIGLLLALKVLLPERIWLVRGNHEERGMNKRYGFFEECKTRMGREVGSNFFETVERVFDHLPFACLIDHRVLVVHGGLGDGTWMVDDLRDIVRPLPEDALYDVDNHWLFNVLWSDPIEDDDKQHGEVFGVHKSPRGGMTTQFGWNITKTFCARNGLGLIVRSHQSKQDSLGFDVMHEDLLMRVFSARDYEGHGNDAAVLFIQPANAADPKSPLLVRPQVLAALESAQQGRSRSKGR